MPHPDFTGKGLIPII